MEQQPAVEGIYSCDYVCAEEDVGYVVLDVGTSTTKAGFRDEDTPRAIFPTVVGRIRHCGGMVGMAQKTEYIGDEAESKRGVLTLHYMPKEGHGIVASWDNMEKIIKHTFYNELRVAPEEVRVVVTNPPHNPKANREKLTQIMFETFYVVGFCTRPSSVCAVNGAGFTTGLNIDMGESGCTVTPVVDNAQVEEGIVISPVGGGDVACALKKYVIPKWAEFVRPYNVKYLHDIKNRLGFVTNDFQRDLDKYSQEANFSLYMLAHRDCEEIYIGPERFQCTEILFDGSEQEGIGPYTKLQDVVQESLLRIPEKLAEKLRTKMVLSGGTSKFRGLPERLAREVTQVTGKECSFISNNEAADRSHLAWLGAAKIASQPPTIFISKEEYDEIGPSAVHHKCFC